MCVYSIDANKAYLNDNYPLPRVDQLVNATSDHELLTFIDTFSGYNHIIMVLEDREHTSFNTH